MKLRLEYYTESYSLLQLLLLQPQLVSVLIKLLLTSDFLPVSDLSMPSALSTLSAMIPLFE